MNAPQFQHNKVARLINTQGESFEFKRLGVNEYGEPSEVIATIVVSGVYHEGLGYVYLNKTGTDATTRRQKAFPMVLVLWEDSQKLTHKDQLSYKGKLYQVSEIHSISEAHVAAEVSLEEVQGP